MDPAVAQPTPPGKARLVQLLVGSALAGAAIGALAPGPDFVLPVILLLSVAAGLSSLWSP